jgi:hypothetical protein
MVVWKGWGWLAAIIPMAGYVLMTHWADATRGHGYSDAHGWAGGIGTILGAVAAWIVADKLEGPGRTLVDQKTNETVVLKRQDSLFFIPMKYFSILVAFSGILMIFNILPLKDR